MAAEKKAPEHTTSAAPASDTAQAEAKDAPVGDGKGYTTTQVLGGDYHTAADGYASFNEGYVQEHVAAQRQIKAAQNLVPASDAKP